MTCSQPPAPGPSDRRCRLKIQIRGAVQGVGFRPTVCRLARELDLQGWVANASSGLTIEVEGLVSVLLVFRDRLVAERPAHSVLEEILSEWLPTAGYLEFAIRESDSAGSPTTLVLPDIATCPECLREILDPSNRRFGYPFTNCTQCGPRFTIVQSVPYDRARTSMRVFPMCPACQAEYDDPGDRRFHAQPNACPVCGPHVELWDPAGRTVCAVSEVLASAARALAEGAILAIKGVGGFHLMVAAHREDSVVRLRESKHRPTKPFAVLFPCLEAVRSECELCDLEEELLGSAAGPVVLVRRRRSLRNGGRQVCGAVAPNNPYLGAMVPSNPLHHLLLRRLDFPVVATSGNLAEEPICIENQAALRRLGAVADLFLVHNRDIVRHADDSILRAMAGREIVLRRARGYAPLPVILKAAKSEAGGGPSAAVSVLGVGAHLKNSIALAVGSRVFLSQHIGDLETSEALAAFTRVIADFQEFYGARAERVAMDAHPDYPSTRWARQNDRLAVPVQHHFAHVLSCMAEHHLAGSALGVCWDGAGLGPDGTVWGGEFLRITPGSFSRFAHWRTFRLPGGDQAAREPRRSALGVLFELFGEGVFEREDLPFRREFTAAELQVLPRMLMRAVNSPLTSSVGRLFDAIAALVGLRQHCSFEGEAAMDLEFAMEEAPAVSAYTCPVAPAGTGARRENTPGEASRAWVVDWAPMIAGVLEDARKGLPVGIISRKVHRSLADSIVRVAELAGERRVVLTGGCFQNKCLLELSVAGLSAAGYEVYWHRLVPPNDGGIALGQVAAVRLGCGKAG